MTTITHSADARQCLDRLATASPPTLHDKLVELRGQRIRVVFIGSSATSEASRVITLRQIGLDYIGDGTVTIPLDAVAYVEAKS